VALARLSQKGFEVLLDDLIEDGAFGSAPLVAGRGHVGEATGLRAKRVGASGHLDEGERKLDQVEPGTPNARRRVGYPGRRRRRQSPPEARVREALGG
jgi:hypothetical protein